MRFLKGCLIFIIIFIVIIFCLWSFYNNRQTKQIILDNELPKKSLLEYKNKIKERNQLIINSKVSDSIKILATKSDSILKNHKKLSEILWTEYRINQSIYKIESFKKINDELNEKYIKYNSAVTEFNSRWTGFPSSITLTNNNLQSYEYMYLIDYGKDNTENMSKRKKADHWIKTGEVIK